MAMRLKGMSEAAQTPIVVIIGDEQVEVPLFTTGDFIVWGQIVDNQRTEFAVKGMTPFDRVQLLAFYRVIPSDYNDLRQRVGSPAGMRYVLTVCYRRARVIAKVHPVTGVVVEPVKEPYPFDPGEKQTDERVTYPKIDALFAANEGPIIQFHAFELCGIATMGKPSGAPPENGDQVGGDDDPLTKRGSSSSSVPPATGTSRSTSSMPHTPIEIPADLPSLD